MSLFESGRMCVKIAGRDAGRRCVVVEQLDSNSVLVDGNVRRRKVNISHLEPLDEVVNIKSGASHEVVTREFEARGLPVWVTNPKQVGARAVMVRKALQKSAQVGAKTAEKKAVKEKTAARAKKKE